MSRIAKVLVVLLALPSLASAQSLEGVWRMTQVTRIGGPNPGVIVLVRTNLLIYTESHFMWVFDRFQPNDPNQDPRP
ncbi:MAG TPA: hypothetical protein VLA09_07220, partial [Longimicrobiales bacterium]|nr:hypothetical protein [Longimicrobiales bacterium]